jgi:hypothetical protein
MEAAYRHAGAQGRYPANARQIMYAARPAVLELTGGKCWKRSSYFTQELLPDFMEEHPDLAAAWDVVFDDRGHLIEPHTQHRIGLGTLEVRDYIGGWHAEVPTDVGSTEFDHDCLTMGPANRYRFALFLEKEGSYPLLEAAQIAERYDIAIMSTKGMSVTAARRLVDDLSQQGVTVLVCHDFDKSGFPSSTPCALTPGATPFKPRPRWWTWGFGWRMCRRWICKVSPWPIPAVSTLASICTSVGRRRRSAISWYRRTTMAAGSGSGLS